MTNLFLPDIGQQKIFKEKMAAYRLIGCIGICGLKWQERNSSDFYGVCEWKGSLYHFYLELDKVAFKVFLKHFRKNFNLENRSFFEVAHFQHQLFRPLLMKVNIMVHPRVKPFWGVHAETIYPLVVLNSKRIEMAEEFGELKIERFPR